MVYKNANGKPGWKARSGQRSATKNRYLHHLVRKGLASWWGPHRTLDDEIRRSGLDAI